MADDSDESTPLDLDAHRPITAERRAWLALRRATSELAHRVRTLEELWNEVEDPRRKVLAGEAAAAARTVGQEGHELGRVLEEFAR